MREGREFYERGGSPLHYAPSARRTRDSPEGEYLNNLRQTPVGFCYARSASAIAVVKAAMLLLVMPATLMRPLPTM